MGPNRGWLITSRADSRLVLVNGFPGRRLQMPLEEAGRGTAPMLGSWGSLGAGGAAVAEVSSLLSRPEGSFRRQIRQQQVFTH